MLWTLKYFVGYFFIIILKIKIIIIPLSFFELRLMLQISFTKGVEEFVISKLTR